MTFEEALPLLKDGEKVVRTGWSGAEQFVKLYDSLAVKEKELLPVMPFLLIYVSGEGYSMWSPTPCDVLAGDWVLVDE